MSPLRGSAFRIRSNLWLVMGMAVAMTYFVGTHPQEEYYDITTNQKSTPTPEPTDILSELGKLFVGNSPSQTICAQLDGKPPTFRWFFDLQRTYRDQRGQQEAFEIFLDCMQHLEQSQERVRSNRISPNIPCKEPQVFLHSFWDGPLGKPAQLGLISSVYAHGPNCAKLTVWTLEDPSNHNSLQIEQALRPFLGNHLQLSIFNATELVLHKILPQYPNLKPPTAALLNAMNYCTIEKAKYSDLVRVFVLAAHGGGIYLDSDVLVLNSLAPLVATPRDFWYSWSYTKYANTAVLSFRNQSPAVESILKLMLSQHRLDHAAHVAHPFQLTRRFHKMFELLPSAYFDPHWVILDMEWTKLQQYTLLKYGSEGCGPSFFQNNHQAKTRLSTMPDTVRELFFPGVFAYHWHNSFGEEFDNHSIAQLFWLNFDAIRLRGDYLSDSDANDLTSLIIE